MERTNEQYENLQSLLRRYMAGETDAAESARAEGWLRDNISDPAYDGLFAALLADTRADIDPGRMERARRMMNQMLGEPVHPRRLSARRILRRAAGYAAAAVIGAVLLLGLLPRHGEVEWIEQYAPHGQTAEVVLPDGSQVWLNSGTRLFYPSRFGGSSRPVFVDGEIFADVVSDPGRPFTVSVAGAKVRVLGTRFGVKSYAGSENIEIMLAEGSVALEAGERFHTLEPGEMVRYGFRSGVMESYRVDTDTYGAWNDNLCFVNHTLAQIAADLERRFDVRIIVEDDTLAATRYYASFVNDESLEQILRALAPGGTIRMTRIDNTIVLSPR